ncbi:MAG TPA: hypothetical protein DCQ14_01290 [Firmicutes bacterium]|nr:hypothetical protein [Bacillota bacterium]
MIKWSIWPYCPANKRRLEVVKLKKAPVTAPALVLLLLFLLLAVFLLDWAGPPKQSVSAEPPRSTDMAVIGGTTAALLTALHAAQNGAQVYLFPQGQELGSDLSFLLAEGLAAPLTPVQEKLGVSFTPVEFKELLRAKGEDMHDPVLLNAFIQFSPYLYTFWEKLSGVSFDYLPDAAGKPYLHSFNPAHQPDPASVRRELELKLHRAGVMIRDDAVQELLFSLDGAVSGLVLTRKGEIKEMINLRSVVLADGGYSGELQHWHRFLQPEYIKALRPHEKGWGLRFAAARGMDLLQTGFLRRRLILYAPTDGIYCFFSRHSWKDAYLLNSKEQLPVRNGQGEADFLHFVQNSPPGGVFLLAALEDIPATCAPFFRNFSDWENQALLPGSGFSSFPHPPGAVRLAAPVRVGIDYTPDGLAVTPRGEVKRSGTIVKGLYAAGEICGGLHGKFVLPGMPLSETIFLAATAGEAAARHAWR